MLCGGALSPEEDKRQRTRSLYFHVESNALGVRNALASEMPPPAQAGSLEYNL